MEWKWAGYLRGCFSYWCYTSLLFAFLQRKHIFLLHFVFLSLFKNQIDRLENAFAVNKMRDPPSEILCMWFSQQLDELAWILGFFPFVPPHLSGCVLFEPQIARAIILHDESLCNGVCSVTGVCITYWESTNGKDSKSHM